MIVLLRSLWFAAGSFLSRLTQFLHSLYRENRKISCIIHSHSSLALAEMPYLPQVSTIKLPYLRVACYVPYSARCPSPTTVHPVSPSDLRPCSAPIQLCILTAGRKGVLEDNEGCVPRYLHIRKGTERCSPTGYSRHDTERIWHITRLRDELFTILQRK